MLHCPGYTHNEIALNWLKYYRLINPVVVSPTIAAVGLSFYSYGFPLVGNCLEIGIVQILLVIIFSLVSYAHFDPSLCLLVAGIVLIITLHYTYQKNNNNYFTSC